MHEDESVLNCQNEWSAYPVSFFINDLHRFIKHLHYVRQWTSLAAGKQHLFCPAIKISTSRFLARQTLFFLHFHDFFILHSYNSELLKIQCFKKNMNLWNYSKICYTFLKYWFIIMISLQSSKACWRGKSSRHIKPNFSPFLQYLFCHFVVWKSQSSFLFTILLFRNSPFVFHRWKNIRWIWNHMRVRKWWQDFHVSGWLLIVMSALTK